MLIGFARRYQYPVYLCTFSDRVCYSSSSWRTDYLELALEFIERYGAFGGTNICPALQEILYNAKHNMTIYVISDMEIYDIQASLLYFK